MYGTETVSRSEKGMERIKQISSWLKEKTYLRLYSFKRKRILSYGFYTEPHERLMGVFIFKMKSRFLFVRKWRPVRREQPAGRIWDHRIRGSSKPLGTHIFSASKAKQPCSKVAVEKETLALSRAEMLQAVTSGAELVSAEERLNQIRVIKDEKEISISVKRPSLPITESKQEPPH